MTEKDFRRIVLALDGAVEGAHMGHPDFRAHGRIFASLRDPSKADLARSGPSRFAVVMLAPQQQQHFVAASPAFTSESGAWGQAGCTRVCLEDVDEELLGEAVTLAWQNAAAKAVGAGKKSSAKRKTDRTKALGRTTKRSAAARKRAMR